MEDVVADPPVRIDEGEVGTRPSWSWVNVAVAGGAVVLMDLRSFDVTNEVLMRTGFQF